MQKMEYIEFIKIHHNQLVNSAVPELYWPTLFEKLSQEIYDAGSVFQLQQVQQESDDGESVVSWQVACTAEEDISTAHKNHIYLIDHAWTYKTDEARPALKAVPGLAARMAALMDVPTEGRDAHSVNGDILAAMWRFNQTYAFGNTEMGSEDSLPKWYIMDEFGSRIQHSAEPNVRVVPFFSGIHSFCFSIMWPVKDIENGEEVTRDYVWGEQNPERREARLCAWHDDIDLTLVPLDQPEPQPEFFKITGATDSLPGENFKHSGLPTNRKLKVFLEYKEFREFLTDKRFELVYEPKDADILWYMRHFHEFKELSESCPDVLINQFPNESLITTKNKLAIVARRAASADSCEPLNSDPSWLPVTYDLQTELPQFVSHFQQRKKKDRNNVWICKPWNLARSLDISISGNLSHIIRLRETGPKVACKYIEDPVLFYRDDLDAKVKFDVRYLILLTSVEPLKIFTYKVFWLRFANKPFSMEHLGDYEQHFTVMNYVDEGKKLKQVHYDDFIPEFEAQNPGHPWQDIENKIHSVLRELMQCATSRPWPQGIPHSPQSRAMYAADLMLTWKMNAAGEREIQPQICEVNFSPDCARACKYHPFFANDMFSALFLGDLPDRVVPL